VRGRDPLRVESGRDATKAQTLGPLSADVGDDRRGHRGGPTASRGRLRKSVRRAAPLGEEPLELVGRDEDCAPRHTHGLDVRQDATNEGRAANAKRLGGLSSRVRKPDDLLGGPEIRAALHPGRGARAPRPRHLGAPPTSTRHGQILHEC
jgi:hypothetical protein